MKKNQHLKKDKNKTTQEYLNKGNEIIGQMLQVLMRAQRKVEDKAYRKIMQQIDENK